MKPISLKELVDCCIFGVKKPTRDVAGRVGAHHADAPPFRDAVDREWHDDAEIDVIPAIDQQRLQRRVAVAIRRGGGRHDCLQHVGTLEAGLCRDHHGVGRVDADHVLDLLPDFPAGRRQVNLAEDRHDLVAGVERMIDVGDV